MINHTCQFFLSEGGCKFGKSCYYIHENQPKIEEIKGEQEQIIQVCYLIDCNKVLAEYQEVAKQSISHLKNQIVQNFPNYRLKVAAIAYRSLQDKKNIEQFDFTDKLIRAEQFLDSLEYEVRDTDSTDFNGGLENAVEYINWTDKASKLIVVITNQPNYGSAYGSQKDNYQTFPKGLPKGCERKLLYEILNKMIDKDIQPLIIYISKQTDVMFSQIKQKFLEKANNDIKILKLPSDLNEQIVRLASGILDCLKKINKTNFGKSVGQQQETEITKEITQMRKTLFRIIYFTESKIFEQIKNNDRQIKFSGLDVENKKTSLQQSENNLKGSIISIKKLMSDFNREDLIYYKDIYFQEYKLNLIQKELQPSKHLTQLFENSLLLFSFESRQDILNGIDNYQFKKVKEITFEELTQEFRFDETNIIGQGAFGRVYKAMSNQDNSFRAIQILFSQNYDDYLFNLQEIDIITRLDRHPNIIKYDYVSRWEKQNMLGSKEYYIAIVMELGDKNLTGVIEYHRIQLTQPPVEQCKLYLKQSLLGLQHLMSQKIYHRDIQPDNLIVFFQDQNQIQISDFGISKPKQDLSKAHTVLGTPIYESPILFQGMMEKQLKIVHDLEQSDIFSLGLTILQFCGALDFIEVYGCNAFKQGEKQINDLINLHVNDKFLQDILFQMLAIDENKRSNYKQLLELFKYNK